MPLLSKNRFQLLYCTCKNTFARKSIKQNLWLLEKLIMAEALISSIWVLHTTSIIEVIVTVDIKNSFSICGLRSSIAMHGGVWAAQGHCNQLKTMKVIQIGIYSKALHDYIEQQIHTYRHFMLTLSTYKVFQNYKHTNNDYKTKCMYTYAMPQNCA